MLYSRVIESAIRSSDVQQQLLQQAQFIRLIVPLLELIEGKNVTWCLIRQLIFIFAS